MVVAEAGLGLVRTRHFPGFNEALFSGASEKLLSMPYFAGLVGHLWSEQNG
jgi:hypothetical protein